jgi:predicted RNA binding protein YcfA (HicA-like mRNA interferase family)
MSGKEVCAILERRGCSEVRRRGSHIVMQRVEDDGSTTTVPVSDHKQVKKGTLRSSSVNRVYLASSSPFAARRCWA